jgi:leucyl aminopeptidase (aminopeptidase T)
MRGDRILLSIASDATVQLGIAGLFANEARNLGVDCTVKPPSSSAYFNASEFLEYSHVVHASNTQSLFRHELLGYLRQHRGVGARHFRMFGFSSELFEQSFHVSKRTLRDLNAAVIQFARSSQTLRVTSAVGTDLRIDLDHSSGWTTSFGHFDGRFPGVLPPGEINTYADAVSGVLVVDGAINSSLPFRGDPRLGLQRRITLELRGGEVIGWSSTDTKLSMVLRSFFDVPNSRRVGEIGIGTNVGMSEYVGFVSHINERWPGFHLGLGTPTRPMSEVGWTCPFHMDFILRDCELYFDDTVVFQDGRFALVPAPASPESGETLFVDAV